MFKGNNLYIRQDDYDKNKLDIGIRDKSGYCFNVASFKNLSQLKRFNKKMGIKILGGANGYDGMTNYTIINNNKPFWNKNEIPRGAKRIKALSNGSLVDCYYIKDKKNKTITIYRPNPNAKKVYKPLSLKKHIKYVFLSI